MRNIDIIDTSSNDVYLLKNVTFVFSFTISDEFLNIAIVLMNKIKFSRKLINFINKYERKKGKIYKICKFFIETNYIIQVNRIQMQIFINIQYI